MAPSKSLLTGVFLVLTHLIFSQNSTAYYQEAEACMRKGEYDMAIEHFYKVSDMPDLEYKMTICSLMSNRFKGLLIDRFLAYEKAEDPLFHYWLGNIYLHRGFVDLSKETFQYFISKNESNGRMISYMTDAQAKINYMNTASPVKIHPMESPVNSRYADEVGGFCMGADGNKMVFASDRKEPHVFEIYFSELGEYGWSSPELIFDQKIPKEQLDLLAFREGFIFFDPSVSAMCVVQREDGKWKKSEKIDIPNLSHSSHVYINKYKSRVIFSEKNEAGDLDLYEAFILRSSGSWMDPVIISPKINSPFNEDYAFLTDDRKRVYFSSDRPGGLGKRDIYYSEFNEESKTWSDPVNMGFPINSVADDVDFRIISDGKAIFSSDRFDSVGYLDLFLVDLQD